MPNDFTAGATGIEAKHPSGFAYSVWPSWLAARQSSVVVARYADVFRKHRDLAEMEALSKHERGESPVILSDRDPIRIR